MKCPMCRQLVTCLLPLYNQAEEQQRSAEFNEMFAKINNYNRRFSGAPRNVSLKLIALSSRQKNIFLGVNFFPLFFAV